MKPPWPRRSGIDFELAKNRALLENISDLAYVCDDKGNIIYVNHVFEKLSGHAASEFIGRPFSNLFNEKDLKTANDAYLRTLKGESPVYEIAFVRTGTLCEYRNHPFKDRDGLIIGVLGTARDITEKKKAFEELEKNDFFLREAQRVARIGSYVLEFETGLWTSSDVMDEIFGIDSDFKRDLDAWGRLLHPEHRDEMLDYFRVHVIAGRNDFDREYRIVRLSDRAETVGQRTRQACIQLRRKTGQDDRDHSGHNREEKDRGDAQVREPEPRAARAGAHQALSASEARYRALVDTIPYGIEECDTEGVITFSNPAYARMCGYGIADLIGMSHMRSARFRRGE